MTNTNDAVLNRVARRLHRDIELGDAREMPWLELDNEGQDYYRAVAMWFINALEASDYDVGTATAVLVNVFLEVNHNRIGETTAIAAAVERSVIAVNGVLKGGK